MNSSRSLPTLHEQPETTPWPTDVWPRHPDPEHRARVGEMLDDFFTDAAQARLGSTFALLVAERGQLVAERYADGHDATTTLPSWSMAKSILHALVGTLVEEGRLDPAQPAPVPSWQTDASDPRREITLEHLLRMSSGLRFNEAYKLDQPSDCIEMLFKSGQTDVAGFAERFDLEAKPGTCWNYSSGTSNIISAIVHRTLNAYGDDHRKLLFDRVFDRIGMKSVQPRYDEAGTWIASSFAFSTAQDFARFGLLYLRDGIWEGERILPARWVDHARTETPCSDGWYGAHFWLAKDGSGRFSCNGFRSQYILMDPERDLVLVRLGDSDDEQKRALWLALLEVISNSPRTS